LPHAEKSGPFPPNVPVPKPRTGTLKPDAPSKRCSMVLSFVRLGPNVRSTAASSREHHPQTFFRNREESMDRLDELNLFVRVAEMGSITAAARGLEISTSVASQRIKRLEQRLGVKLLHRTTRRLALTVEGAALLEQVRPLLDELDAITSGVGRAGREIAGTLRVTMPAAFGRLYVSPLLPHFRARHPALD